MKKSLKKLVKGSSKASAPRKDQWRVDDALVFSGDSLEPRVLLNGVAMGQPSDAVVANDDTIVFNEDSIVTFRVGNLLDNDTGTQSSLSVGDVTFNGQSSSLSNANAFAFEIAGDFGTLFYNTDGDYLYLFDNNVDALAFGEQVSDEFEYTALDSFSGGDTATLKVTINGTNDAPEFASEVAATLDIKEQATPATIEETLSATFTDLDVNDIHDVQINGVFLNGEVAPGLSSGDFKTDGTFFDFLTINSVNQGAGAANTVEFSFEADASALNYLDAGDQLYLSYEISVTDPEGEVATAVVEVHITGTEDKPLLWVEESGAVTEDGPTIATGILGVDGVDEDDRSTFLPNNPTNSNGIFGLFGNLTVEVDENGLESWVYRLRNNTDAVQSLNEGEVVQDSFSLAIYDNGQVQYKLDDYGDPLQDANGNLIPHLIHITIDITGTDDEPVVTYEPAWVAEGDVGHPTFVEGVVTIVDIDSNDNPTFATNPLQPGSGTGVGTFGEITSVVQISNPAFDSSDPLSPEFIEVFTYVPNQELIQFLAEGEELTDVVELTAYDYTLVDNNGNVIVRELDTHSVDIVIKGTNDSPEAGFDSETIWEDPEKDSIGVTLTAEGSVVVSDVDLSDVVTVADVSLGNVSAQQEVLDADGNFLRYELIPFSRDINAFDSLNTSVAGSADTLLSYLTVTNSPIVAAGADTGVLEWSFNSGSEGFDFLDSGERAVINYAVTVVDSQGATAVADIRLIILGKNDRPDIFVGEHDSDFAVIKEASSFDDADSQDTPGYFTSGTLSVFDIDASDSVTAFEGFGYGVTDVVVDSTNPIPPGVGLSNADFLDMFSLLDATTVVGVGETEGTLEWVFETNEGFDFLAKGEQLTLTYTIEVSDKDHSDTQEVVIVIEGTNDRPTVKNQIDFHRRDYRGDSENSIDADDFDNNGTLVSDLIRSQQEDVDVFGSLQGIAVQGFNFDFTTTGAELWEFSTDGGATWTAFDADLSADNATVLSTDARVRFVPDSGGQNTGWAQLKFVLWDQTDGNASGTTGVDSTERFTFDNDGNVHGESAYGTEMLYFTVEVNAPAADAPTAVDDNFEVPFDSVTTLPSVIGNDIDPDSTNLIASLIGSPAGVTLFSDGTFTFDSTGLQPNQSVSFQYVVSDGTSSDIGTVTIVVGAPGFDIQGPETVVLGKTDNIYSASTGGLNFTSQTWSVDGVVVSNDADFEFNPQSPGDFVLTFTGTTANGTVDSESITVSVVPAAIVNGNLLVGGTTASDSITVNLVGSGYVVNVNGFISTFAVADVTGDIVICGLAGDDDIRVGTTITQRARIFGGNGDDTIFGGGGDDLIFAGNGDDVVFGRSGNDGILGQNGNDELFGQAGDDEIVTGDGTDFAQGGLGNDWLLGGSGVDTIEGNAGDDELFGGDDNDVLSGGVGQDTVFGQNGDDTLLGNGGDDVIFGGAGNDELTGGIGDDELVGNVGDDVIFGQSGDDVIDGGIGNDTVFAGIGNDNVLGGIGDDTLQGNSGNDVIDGGTGNDELFGGNGNDQIFGGFGNDILNGNTGNDILDGQQGNDTLNGVQGNDTLTGGVGIDVLNGGAGIDTAIDVGETEILIEL